jgi:hypothetical protein
MEDNPEPKVGPTVLKASLVVRDSVKQIAAIDRASADETEAVRPGRMKGAKSKQSDGVGKLHLIYRNPPGGGPLKGRTTTRGGSDNRKSWK